MKTAVRRVLLMSALLSPSALYALGLGEIRLNSALNQPFDAEIELVSAAQEDLAALRASLASSDTFLRYGLDKPSYLSDFTFQVVRVGGRDVLRVTSPKPVTEPFVTLLVEANWPRGRLLREYTVLLDPPVFAPAPAAAEPAVATPRAASAPPPPAPRPEAAAAPAPVPSAPRASRPVAVAAAIEPGASYRVQPNDTLWQIASAAYPGTRADVNRAMVAIYQANPGAFGSNINVLRAGSELRIPASADLAAISASAAASEVTRQNQLWREGVAPSPDAAADGGRLRLVTPEQGSPTPSTATAAPAAAAPAAGGAELQSRVQQLEAELAEVRRLLEVRNAELATLQGGAAAAEPGAAGEPAGTEAPVVEAAEPAAEPAAAAVEPAPEAEPAAEPAAEAEEPGEAAAPAEAPSLLDRLLAYWWVLLGVLIAALGVVAFLRRRSEQGSAEDSLEEALGNRDLRKAQAEERVKSHDIKVEEQQAGDRTMKLARPAILAAAPREREPVPATLEDTLSGEGPLAIESGDPLAEADFHMAYGLYDQAADLVQVASKREPERRDLRVKLLEIYFVWGNRDRFLDLANELAKTRDQSEPGEWDKVLIMGKQLAPEDPLFRGPIHSMGGDLDMDLKGATGTIKIDMLVDRSPGETTRTQKIERGDDLDFLLDEPSRGVDEGTGTYVPTVELPRPRVGLSEDPTAEVGIMDLGLDMGDLPGLDDDDVLASMKSEKKKAPVEDTIESETLRRAKAMPEEDLLTASNILGSAATAAAIEKSAASASDSMSVTSLVPTVELNKLDAASETSELPALEPTVEMNKVDETGVLPTVLVSELEMDEGGSVADETEIESHTMSEVGTKLDLARAYVDMGDPEGARSILEEVVKEGSAAQKQEAERLMASLP